MLPTQISVCTPAASNWSLLPIPLALGLPLHPAVPWLNVSWSMFAAFACVGEK